MVIETVAETGSTNEDLRERAAAGAPEGLWLRADRQTGGKGRLGRVWSSPEGNLHASTIVRLRPSDPPAPTLALLAAVALDGVVGAYVPSVCVQIKWPNDLLLLRGKDSGGGEIWAKLAGILLERAGDAVVIGFGVNLAHAPTLADRPVACLADAGFMEALAANVAHWLAHWRSRGLAGLRSQWLLRAHPVGTRLIAQGTDGTQKEGLFAGLDPSGALLLQTSERMRVITAGDVFLVSEP